MQSVKLDYIILLQHRHNLSFSLKPSSSQGIRRQIEAQKLNSDKPVQLHVFAAIDVAHATGPELGEHSILFIDNRIDSQLVAQGIVSQVESGSSIYTQCQCRRVSIGVHSCLQFLHVIYRSVSFRTMNRIYKSNLSGTYYQDINAPKLLRATQANLFSCHCLRPGVW